MKMSRHGLKWAMLIWMEKSGFLIFLKNKNKQMKLIKNNNLLVMKSMRQWSLGHWKNKASKLNEREL